MKHINYRVTVHTAETTLRLGFYGILPEEMGKERIRMQAVFSGKAIDRRIPMQVELEKGKEGIQIIGEVTVQLPYVFYNMPRRQVEVKFSLWCGVEEIILDAQHISLDRTLFLREEETNKKNLPAFIGYTLLLPVLLAGYYFKEEKNLKQAKHVVNERVYRLTGHSYSPRQEHTDFFAEAYERESAKSRGPEKNLILFLSEREPEETGNLMLLRRLFEQDPEVEITDFINTRTVDLLSKAELRECAEKCARARLIILEDFYPQLHKLHIHRDTRIVQLWHACGAFKTFGFSHMDKPGGVSQQSMNHRNYDLVCVSSEAVRGIYAEAFGVPSAKVQALGVPRTDLLYDWEYKMNKRNQLYEKYPDLKDSSVILFAPTFRGDGNKDAFYPQERFEISRFMEHMPEDTVLVIKQHPFVEKPWRIDEPWQDRVYDLSGEESINDLMLLSDLMITDYSSAVFEAAILELPVLFYAFDEEEYMQSRDFYFSLESFATGPVTHNMEELIAAAADYFDCGYEGKYLSQEKAQAFKNNFLEALDGHSTQRIYEYIKNNFLKDKKHGGDSRR